MKDTFYRDMIDYQLKAVLKEISLNLEADSSDNGMQKNWLYV